MYSTSPADTCQPSSRCTLGCRRSRSISSTRFCERATSEARLTAKVVLPSSGKDEVTNTTFGGVCGLASFSAVNTPRIASA